MTHWSLERQTEKAMEWHEQDMWDRCTCRVVSMSRLEVVRRHRSDKAAHRFVRQTTESRCLRYLPPDIKVGDTFEI